MHFLWIISEVKRSHQTIFLQAFSLYADPIRIIHQFLARSSLQNWCESIIAVSNCTFRILFFARDGSIAKHLLRKPPRPTATPPRLRWGVCLRARVLFSAAFYPIYVVPKLCIINHLASGLPIHPPLPDKTTP